MHWREDAKIFYAEQTREIGGSETRDADESEVIISQEDQQGNDASTLGT